MGFWYVFVDMCPFLSMLIVRSRKLVWLVGSSVSHFSFVWLLRSWEN